MKKVSIYVFLVLMICNIALSKSSLPECEGNDKNVSSFSLGYFNKIRKIALINYSVFIISLSIASVYFLYYNYYNTVKLNKIMTNS